jgi:hypothetical protein
MGNKGVFIKFCGSTDFLAFSKGIFLDGLMLNAVNISGLSLLLTFSLP